MKQFSVPMALVDYIPVILFLLSFLTVFKNLKNKISVVSKAMIGVGGVLVIAAGGLKATYKLLYALNVGDFEWMSNQFFSNQAIGFLLLGIGLVLTVKPVSKHLNALFPTMVLVLLMVIGLGAMDAVLAYYATKMKKRGALVCFIVSFFLTMMMGYLSSKDFTQASMNWIAQGINCAGMLLLYLGVKSLDKAGLGK
ncbi:MAG: hypothetical protein IJI78_07355 [Oscillospiraceae bacterium]|nr:hypothetical protein [Oscillospiraceae bacterium]